MSEEGVTVLQMGTQQGEDPKLGAVKSSEFGEEKL